MQIVFSKASNKKVTLIKSSLSIIILSFMLCAVFSYAGQDAETVDSAHISYIEGAGTIYHGFNQKNEEAFVNAMLMQGDSLETHNDAMAELFFPNGIIIRMNQNSKINLLSLDSKNFSEIIVRFYAGDIIVDSTFAYGEGSFRIDTVDCGIFLIQQGYFRVVSGQYTDVMVYDGAVEVAAENNSFSLASSQRLFNAASPESQPEYFNTTTNDNFTQWSASRLEQYAEQEMNNEYADAADSNEPAGPDFYIDWWYEPVYTDPLDIFNVFIPFGRYWYNPGEYDPNKPYYNNAGFNPQSCNDNSFRDNYTNYAPGFDTIKGDRDIPVRKIYDNKPVTPSHGTEATRNHDTIERSRDTYSPQPASRPNSGSNSPDRQRSSSSGSTPAKRKK
ncbi:MAG: hypothetical protein A2Y62_20140 [Candidatus Fischerbacteria bacterium RBG_13_37_8]|uniref:FecR protein domain-containing protein n=1 Tax=Candidatus Fischerbacteria bacterium RBG_13_37_8 TaxID=1817863 RepID=A0A1F5V5F0_9BACT|nr:MAG: hypothetical protein A2Y62_20140 [Candidatus Fischerbacteria bacterium RBG_13_37_8]